MVLITIRKLKRIGSDVPELESNSEAFGVLGAGECVYEYSDNAAWHRL